MSSELRYGEEQLPRLHVQGTKLRWPNKAYRESKRRVKEQWVNIHYPVTAR